MTLSPAYGKDYKSKKEVLEAWNADKDFIIEDFLSPACGKPTNQSNLLRLGVKEIIQIRYNKLRKVLVINLK